MNQYRVINFLSSPLKVLSENGTLLEIPSVGELRLVAGLVCMCGRLMYGPNQEPIPLIQRTRSLGLDTSSPGYKAFQTVVDNDVIITSKEVGAFLKEQVQMRAMICVVGDMPATILSPDCQDWAVSGLHLL